MQWMIVFLFIIERFYVISEQHMWINLMLVPFNKIFLGWIDAVIKLWDWGSKYYIPSNSKQMTADFCYSRVKSNYKLCCLYIYSSTE